MVNFNGEILDSSEVELSLDNRAFKYGDAVFETMKFSYGKIMFWEDHYFRLMTGMRITRMTIPMTFSPEYLEELILETIAANHTEQNANRIRLTVYRKGGGTYTPKINDVEFVITTEMWPYQEYEINPVGITLDLFKDHYKPTGLISGLKSANALLYVLASVYKQENDLDECILINAEKHVVEAISSNIFMVKGNTIITPPESTGCLKGVMRKNVIKLVKQSNFEILEDSFSPFELQRANEVFLTNALHGIQWVKNYKKKVYQNGISSEIIQMLNESAS